MQSTALQQLLVLPSYSCMMHVSCWSKKKKKKNVSEHRMRGGV